MTVTTIAREGEPAALEAIFASIGEGEVVSAACDAAGLHVRTFWRRVAADEAIRVAYETALACRAHVLAEQIVELADQRPAMVEDTNHKAGGARMDSADVAWRKNQIDARKWVISKLLPKKYGDKIDHTVAAPDGGPVGIRVVFGRD